MVSVVSSYDGVESQELQAGVPVVITPPLCISSHSVGESRRRIISCAFAHSSVVSIVHLKTWVLIVKWN